MGQSCKTGESWNSFSSRFQSGRLKAGKSRLDSVMLQDVMIGEKLTMSTIQLTISAYEYEDANAL